MGKVFEEIKKLSNEVIKEKNKNPNHSITQLLNYFSHPWQKEFRQFLKEVKDDKRFIFLGFIDDYRLIKLYKQAKVNILISRDEGFGFSYLEAASQGCPSVLSDIPVLKEIAGSSAFFAHSNDPYDLANKIGEVYFNNALREKMAIKAWERSQYFSADKFKKGFLSLIKNG